jgi:hypothetical protein
MLLREGVMAREAAGHERSDYQSREQDNAAH